MGAMQFSTSQTFVLIMVLGFLGHRLLKLLHIPGGAISGSLAMVAFISSMGVEWSELPFYISTCFQMILGIIIGCKFNKEKVPQIKSLLVPSIFVTGWLISISLMMGMLLAAVTGLDLGTALFGSVPGGISEMGIVAMAYHLSVPVVSLLQFVRVIAVNFCFPTIAYKYKIKYNKTEEEKDTTEELPAAHGAEESNRKTLPLFITLILAGIGGFTARFLGVPAGGLLGSMVIVACLRIAGVPLKEVPRWALVFAQVGLGSYLGTTFTPDVVNTLRALLLPTAVFSIIVVINGIVLGLVVHRIFGWDLVTSLLAAAPAGAPLMSAIALDMDADAITVSSVHAIRLVIILMSMPSIINAIVR